MKKKSLFVFIVGLCTLTGCVSLVKAPKEATTTFVLEGDKNQPEAERDPLPLVLYVPRATAPAYLDSNRILFSRNGATLSAYQYAQWAEPPPARLTALLVDHLERQRLFRAVTRHTSGTSPDLALNLEVLDFRHDAASTPGQVTLRLRAEIVDLRGARIVATRLFEDYAALPTADAPTVAATLGEITRRTVSAVIKWMGDLAKKPLPQAVVVER